MDPRNFVLQISKDKEFKEIDICVKTEMNMYTALAPFPEGTTYYWRVGSSLKGSESVEWSKVFNFTIPQDAQIWDRTILKNPNFGDHPRLLFRKGEYLNLKELAYDSPIFTEQMVQAAEEMVRHKWWDCWPRNDAEVDEFTKSKSGSNKVLWNLTRKLTQTAFVYLVTEDEKYSNVIDIWTRIAAYPRGGPASPEGMGNGYAEAEDNTSITEYIALVYDWFYDKLTQQQRKIFETSLEWRISAFMYDFRWGGAIYTDGKDNPKLSPHSIALGGYGHNWEGMLATFPAAIVLYEKSDIAKRYFHWVANYLIAVGEACSQGDGYGLGAHYSQSHMKWLIYQLLYLNKALPGLELRKNPLYHKYADFFIGLVPVGMTNSHFGRLSQHGAGIMMRNEMFGLLAYLLEDGEVLSNWEAIKETHYLPVWRQWIHVAAPLQISEDLKPAHSTKKTYLHPLTGYVMAHAFNPSEKIAYEEGVGVIFCAKPSRTDEYNNDNTFQMYAYGQNLNFGGHSGDENPYGHQTIAHNTIMVDGIGQGNTEDSERNGFRSLLLAYKEDSGYVYWMGDATNTYPKKISEEKLKGWAAVTQIAIDSNAIGERGVPKLERFRRHMLFMRDKYLLIFDDLKTEKGHASQFSWRYRILPDCNLTYDKQGGISYDIGNVEVQIEHIAFPSDLTYNDLKLRDQFKNPITGYDFYDNDFVKKDMENPRYHKMMANHNLWVTTKEPKENHHFFTVIYPVKPGSDSPRIIRLDDYTVKVENQEEVDVISFDVNTKHPANLVIDLKSLQFPIVID
jgi:hypothetical protein